jgi:uncharacterized membrane protein
MLKYLIQVVRDAVAAGILTGMALAFAEAAGGREHRRRVAWGIVAGVGAAAVLAALRASSVIRRREYINLTVLSAAIIAEIIFLVIIWAASRKKPSNLREIFAVASAALLPVYGMTGVFLYIKEFVRAGESVFGADVLLRVAGFLCGLFIAALSGAAARAASGRAGAAATRAALTAGLAVSVISQISALLQTLMSRRLIPVPDALFDIVTFTVNHTDWFLYAVIAISLIPIAAVCAERPPPDGAFKNPAERRRSRASRRSAVRWCAVALACCLSSVVSLTALRALDEREVTLTPAEPMDIVSGNVVLPLERIGDGHLHRFVYTASDGIEVRFIVIKKNDVSYGVGLDACEICGPTGYYERDDEVVCKLCDVVMNKSTIGFKGGCNPVPLAFSIESGSMVIDTQNLENESGRFK